MYAKIESIISGVSEKWPHPYQDQARTRLKVFLDSLLAEERKRDEDARRMLNAFENTHPDYTKSEGLKQQVRTVSSEFERVGFFQRLWRYFTTNIVRMLTLHRLSALKTFREDLEKESIFSDAALKRYERVEENQSWFTRFITPSVPGLRQAIEEMKQEHRQNRVKATDVKNAKDLVRDEAEAEFLSYKKTVSSLFNLDKELEYRRRLLEWDGDGIAPKVDSENDAHKLAEQNNAVISEWSKPTDGDVWSRFAQDSDVAQEKNHLALIQIYKYKRDDYKIKSFQALLNMESLIDDIAKIEPQVSSHLNGILLRKQHTHSHNSSRSIENFSHHLSELRSLVVAMQRSSEIPKKGSAGLTAELSLLRQASLIGQLQDEQSADKGSESLAQEEPLVFQHRNPEEPAFEVENPNILFVQVLGLLKKGEFEEVKKMFGHYGNSDSRFLANKLNKLRNNEGKTLLHASIEEADYRGIEWLLLGGADIFSEDNAKMTPFKLAGRYLLRDIVNVKSANVGRSDFEQFEVPFFYLCSLVSSGFKYAKLTKTPDKEKTERIEPLIRFCEEFTAKAAQYTRLTQERAHALLWRAEPKVKDVFGFDLTAAGAEEIADAYAFIWAYLYRRNEDTLFYLIEQEFRRQNFAGGSILRRIFEELLVNFKRFAQQLESQYNLQQILPESQSLVQSSSSSSSSDRITRETQPSNVHVRSLGPNGFFPESSSSSSNPSEVIHESEQDKISFTVYKMP